MSDGFPNKPRILRGAFVEYGLSVPPLFVVFQYNPEQLSRNLSQSFSVPSEMQEEEFAAQRQWMSLRGLHRKYDDLTDIQDAQDVNFQEETISFDIRLDATDQLEDGDAIAGMAGVLPRLATLERMMQPKSDSLMGAALDALLGSSKGFSFTKREKPPMVLFMWGLTRMLPVNISSMNVLETEFNTFLFPVRATVSVSLTVIEGDNPMSLYSRGAREVMSLLNLANIGEITNVVIPS